jgi:hypothetical protein
MDRCGAGASRTDPLDEGHKGRPRTRPRRYVAEVIVLNRRPAIRIRSVTAHGGFLVGYFANVESINDHGRPIELSDLLVE